VFYDFVGKKLGVITGEDGTLIEVNETFITTDPTLFDALYVVGGTAENQEKFMNIFYLTWKKHTNIISQ